MWQCHDGKKAKHTRDILNILAVTAFEIVDLLEYVLRSFINLKKKENLRFVICLGMCWPWVVGGGWCLPMGGGWLFLVVGGGWLVVVGGGRWLVVGWPWVVADGLKNI